jgi:hypothetical protein
LRGASGDREEENGDSTACFHELIG